MGCPTASLVVMLDHIPKAVGEIELNRDKQVLVIYKYPCSSPSGVYCAVLRYFLGTFRSQLRFNGIPALNTFSALGAVGRFDLMSRYNRSWLDST